MLTALAEGTHLFPGKRIVAAPRLHRALITAFATLVLLATFAALPAVASGQSSRPATITTVLHPGWNMVGWVGPETPASDLFDELPALAGIFAWDGEAGGYRHRARPIVHLLDPLVLIRGQGVWLYLDGDAPVEWTREASEDSVLLELRAGRNLVAWAGRDGTPTAQAVERFDDRLVRAWDWDAEAAQYQLYQPGAASNSLTELNHGDALLVELTEDARWWQSGTAPPPVVFLGEFTDERKAEIGGWSDSGRAVFAERWGVEAPMTTYVGTREDLAPTYRRIRGGDIPERSCGGYSNNIFFVWGCIAEYAVVHDYFHAIQDELSRPHFYDVPHWLLEGSAEYARFVHAALQSGELTVPEYLNSRESVIGAQLGGYVLPGLSEIVSYSDFHGLPNSIGYRIGFIAARWLVDHSSEESMLGFFRDMADSARWQDAFKSAFGMSSSAFSRTFEAYLAEVAPPLPHLTDDSDEPVLVLMGDVPAETGEAVRADFDSVRAFFREQLGAGTADYTILAATEPASVTAAYMRAFGAEPRDGFCQASGASGRVWVLDLECRRTAPRYLDVAHFRNVRRALAPWDELPSMPDGFSTWGPFWLDSPAETYLTYAYRSAAGLEEAEDIRDRAVSSAKPVTRSLESIESGSDLGSESSGARGLGFLALELLAELAGDGALFEYYRLLPESRTWEQAFKGAFGMTHDEFYEAFEAYRVEVAPPFPHQTDGRDEPVLVFVGDVPAETEAAVRDEFDAVQRHFRQQLRARTADYTLYIGPDRDTLVDTHRLLFGTDPPDRLCDRSSHPAGLAIINLGCRGEAPHRLDVHHFVATRDRLAPAASLPDMPAGFGTRGPWWMENPAYWYVLHGYRVARGFEELEASRGRETYRVVHTTRSLESTSTRDGYYEGSSESRALGFLAVEWLATRAGDAAIFEYYRLLPDAESWEEAFEAAFGIAVDDFYVAFEAHRAKVAPPLPHLTDGRDEPVLVFAGDVPAETEAAIRAEFAVVQGHFSRRLGAGTADYTLYFGADGDGLADIHRLLFGTEVSDRFCERSSHPGFALISLRCSAAPPHRLHAHHFVEVRDRLAPRVELPDMPDGFGSRGPRWLENAAYWYALHAYRVARGFEDVDVSRARETNQAVLATRSLESTSTWDGYSESLSESRTLGFLAVEWLATRAGDAAIFEYFRLLPDAESWEEAFETAFGITVDDFYEEFEAYRARVAPPNEGAGSS